MLWKLSDGRFRGYNRNKFKGGGNVQKKIKVLGMTIEKARGYRWEGGRIPCRICLVFNNASECEVSFVFFFLKNMYIHLRVPGLFIDMCVGVYHKIKRQTEFVSQTFLDCLTYLQL